MYIFFPFPPLYFSFPLFHRLRSDLRFKLLQTARSLQPQKHARCVWPRCGALLSLSPRHRERRLVVPELNVLFIASWKTRKFSSLLTPSSLHFASIQSRQRFDSFSYLFHLIYFSFFRILGLERRKENRFLPSFFLNFSWRKFPYFQFKLVFFWSHRFNSDRFLI